MNEHKCVTGLAISIEASLIIIVTAKVDVFFNFHSSDKCWTIWVPLSSQQTQSKLNKANKAVKMLVVQIGCSGSFFGNQVAEY